MPTVELFISDTVSRAVADSVIFILVIIIIGVLNVFDHLYNEHTVIVNAHLSKLSYFRNPLLPPNQNYSVWNSNWLTYFILIYIFFNEYFNTELVTSDYKKYALRNKFYYINRLINRSILFIKTVICQPAQTIKYLIHQIPKFIKIHL